MIPMRRSILILKLFLVSSRVCLAAPCDNIAVQTFDQELVDIGSRNVERVFVLPEGPARRITMTYTLDCPEGGCDPWDRKGNVYVVLPDSSKLEIGRIITPYKKACSWSVDVTPFQQMLQGEVNLGLFIDTWVGGGQGWLVSVDFLIEQGVADQEPIGVVSLWQGNPELGNYLDWLGGESINTTFFGTSIKFTVLPCISCLIKYKRNGNI